jgi:hypothetical protein
VASSLDKILKPHILREDRPEIILQDLLPNSGASDNITTVQTVPAARKTAIISQLANWQTILAKMQQKIIKNIPENLLTTNNSIVPNNPRNFDPPAFSVSGPGVVDVTPPEVLLAPQINENLQDISQALVEIQNSIDPSPGYLVLEETRVNALQSWHNSARIWTESAYTPISGVDANDLIYSLQTIPALQLPQSTRATIEALINALSLVRAAFQVQLLNQQRGWKKTRDFQLQNLKQAAERLVLQKLQESLYQWESKLVGPIGPIFESFLNSNSSLSSLPKSVAKPLADLRKDYLRARLALEQQTISHYQTRQELLDPIHWQAPRWLRTIDQIIAILQTIDSPELAGATIAAAVQKKIDAKPQTVAPLIPDLFDETPNTIANAGFTPSFVPRISNP